MLNKKSWWMFDVMKLGIDTGGTFTDFILETEEGFKTYKVSSTPHDPSLAILKGLQYLFPDSGNTLGFILPSTLEIVHGTTVGTNAFLERKGAKTLLVTTKGFEDVLFIGRQNRKSLYDLNIKRPPEIISRLQVYGVKERINAFGNIETPLNKKLCKDICQYCRKNEITSVAICLLHSYLNPIHEETIASELAELGIPITSSSQLLPEFREYERLTTTLINAYLAPVISEYVSKLSHSLKPNALSVQQSSGGIIPAEGIAKRAIHTVLSGPAGGVHGAYRLAQEMGIDKMITFDMGGTSTDVSLCDKVPTLTRDYTLDGFPIRTPVIDIHTVGAGGGSIANVDAGGLLHVGPESAGADPGPVCYGQGRRITVTDANLYLGRLLADRFLGGEMTLQYSKVEEKLANLAESLGLASVETALGILRIVNIGMVKAVRAVSLERGYDPQEFALFSFGGASGLHCCDMATELGISKIIVPDRAGILSAQGMVMSEPTLDSSKALFLTGSEITKQNMEPSFTEMEENLTSKMHNLCHCGSFVTERFLDLRYKGQSYEITVGYQDDFTEEFHATHQHHFGYKLPKTLLELVAIRSTVKLEKENFIFPRHAKKIGNMPKEEGRVSIIFEGGKESVPVYQRRSLTVGNRIQGSALIIDNYTTILVQPNFEMTIDPLLNIVLQPVK